MIPVQSSEFYGDEIDLECAKPLSQSHSAGIRFAPYAVTVINQCAGKTEVYVSVCLWKVLSEGLSDNQVAII